MFPVLYMMEHKNMCLTLNWRRITCDLSTMLEASVSGLTPLARSLVPRSMTTNVGDLQSNCSGIEN